MSSIQKVFIKSEDQTLIVCPDCGNSKDVSIGQFRHRQRLLKIKCSCGYRFKIEIEFRQYFRKDTDLDALYKTSHSAAGAGSMVKVINLSLGGVCLEFLNKHNLKVGDGGDLRFKLDNRKESEIIKQLIVMSISGKRVGCQFVKDKAYETDLGFYLRP